MNDRISKEMPRIVAAAGSGIVGGAVGFAMGKAGFPSDIPHLIGGCVVAGSAGAVIVDVAVLVAGKVKGAMASRRADIPEKAWSRGSSEDGVSEDEANVEVEPPKMNLEVYQERERLFPEEYKKPPLTDYTKFHKAPVVELESSERKPIFQITKEEYLSVDNKEYTKADGTFFADGILAGWNDKLDIKDPLDTIGEESVSILSEDGVDGIYVRNDILKIDYQITKSESSYDEAVAELKLYSDIPDEEV